MGLASVEQQWSCLLPNLVVKDQVIFVVVVDVVVVDVVVAVVIIVVVVVASFLTLSSKIRSSLSSSLPSLPSSSSPYHHHCHHHYLNCLDSDHLHLGLQAGYPVYQINLPNWCVFCTDIHYKVTFSFISDPIGCGD